jgi:hypothetical protein
MSLSSRVHSVHLLLHNKRRSGGITPLCGAGTTAGSGTHLSADASALQVPQRVLSDPALGSIG